MACLYLDVTDDQFEALASQDGPLHELTIEDVMDEPVWRTSDLRNWVDDLKARHTVQFDAEARDA